MRPNDRWDPNDDAITRPMPPELLPNFADTQETAPDPASMLSAAAETFKQRNNLYGNSYLAFGAAMAALLPAGIELQGEEAFARFGVFTQCVSKITRYAAQLQAGGHQDSAHDLCVYAAMLETLTPKS
jgi:hypothetical protein